MAPGGWSRCETAPTHTHPQLGNPHISPAIWRGFSLRECLDIREQHLPTGHYLIADTKSTLGESIAMQDRYAEAELLLVESYEPISRHYGPTRPRTIAALNRIVDLYTSWGKTEEAAVWRMQAPDPGVVIE